MVIKKVSFSRMDFNSFKANTVKQSLFIQDVYHGCWKRIYFGVILYWQYSMGYKCAIIGILRDTLSMSISDMSDTKIQLVKYCSADETYRIIAYPIITYRLKKLRPDIVRIQDVLTRKAVSKDMICFVCCTCFFRGKCIKAEG